MRRRGQQGFTMAEIVVVLALVAVGVGMFSSVFVNNWAAYEDRIKRANLWSEANQAFEKMSVDARNSRLIDVTVTANSKTASFTNAADNSVLTYVITDTGNLSRTSGATTKTYSDHVVFADSNFIISGKDLLVDLKLKETILGRDINITASTEVLPRN